MAGGGRYLYFVAMKMANTRKPPTEPGNGLGLYTGGKFSGSGVGGGCTYENPTQEKIGHSVARICLYYSYLYHLIVSLVMLMLPLLFWGGQMVEDMFQYWVVGMTGSVILLTLGRLVSNGLTRKEEHLSYQAVTVLLIGGLVQFIIIVVLDCMLS
ncbi:MAG: hypothetical protein ACI9FG_000051 [Crocinitomicaceae bacterium]|jgi:hypothetical protein